MNRIIILGIALLSLSSCFKEEDPRPSTIQFVETIGMGDDYDTQIFYSLSDTSIVSSNSFKDWDLAFYCGDETSFIRLNSAATAYVVKTESTNFNESFNANYTEEDRRFDGTHGYTQDLAIDIIAPGTGTDTTSLSDTVYIFNPGSDADGNPLGDHKKFIFKGMIDGSYLIKYANLDGSDPRVVTIPKNALLNYVCFSFKTNSVVNIEPDKTTWDLLFSRFTDTVYSTDGTLFLTGYAVTGAYLNPNGVEAYLEESTAFEDIDAYTIDETKLSANLNAIGHDWKQFTDQYYIFKNKSYIIKDRDNRIFKLRFLSFYDSETGAKGFPSFEFEQIQ